MRKKHSLCKPETCDVCRSRHRLFDFLSMRTAHDYEDDDAVKGNDRLFQNSRVLLTLGLPLEQQDS